MGSAQVVRQSSGSSLLCLFGFWTFCSLFVSCVESYDSRLSINHPTPFLLLSPLLQPTVPLLDPTSVRIPPPLPLLMTTTLPPPPPNPHQIRDSMLLEKRDYERWRMTPNRSGERRRIAREVDDQVQRRKLPRSPSSSLPSIRVGEEQEELRGSLREMMVPVGWSTRLSGGMGAAEEVVVGGRGSDNER